MVDLNALKELAHCELCEHRCGVNRLKGKKGICRVTLPVVASAQLHPAPPESYTVFMAGCNFKCLNCQNWTISQFTDSRTRKTGYIAPGVLAEECVKALAAPSARRMGADRIFFSGGEPTIHLPYIEQVAAEARKLKPDIKINFDTNGYMTTPILKRILDFSTSITFDLKAFRDEIHLALTGASSGPVLRNARYIADFSKEKIWEYRIVVIPEMNENEIQPLAEFIAKTDPYMPVCFLAFRPNFVLENHPGASESLMQKCVDIAKRAGLQNAYWSGTTDLPGERGETDPQMIPFYPSEEARLAGTYASTAGCHTHVRNCAECASNQACDLKKYHPGDIT